MMSKFINSLEALKPISPTALAINFLSTLAGFWLLFNNYHSLPAAIPLWFAKDWGVNRLANPILLWLVPSSGLLILAVNNFLATTLRKQNILALILVWFSAFLSLITLYTLYRLLALAI